MILRNWVRPHRLRHTYGTELATAGIDLLVLRELMGHAHPETTAAYVHLSPETLAGEYAQSPGERPMTAFVAHRRVDFDDLMAAYLDHVDSLPIGIDSRHARRRSARYFLAHHSDLDAWLRRPTPARVTDLHRDKAWPFVIWAAVSGRLRIAMSSCCWPSLAVSTCRWCGTASILARSSGPSGGPGAGLERQLGSHRAPVRSHVGTRCVDATRRRVQNDTLGRGRKADPLYRCRKLLAMAEERLDESATSKLRGLLAAGDPAGHVGRGLASKGMSS